MSRAARCPSSASFLLQRRASSPSTADRTHHRIRLSHHADAFSFALSQSDLSATAHPSAKLWKLTSPVTRVVLNTLMLQRGGYAFRSGTNSVSRTVSSTTIQTRDARGSQQRTHVVLIGELRETLVAVEGADHGDTSQVEVHAEQIQRLELQRLRTLHGRPSRLAACGLRPVNSWRSTFGGSFCRMRPRQACTLRSRVANEHDGRRGFMLSTTLVK
jgi:hypothetical protein